ncbi:MAG: prepilin-type N-terminal cleavage/methylation domain-containing protein [Deltaproteobacteria bacterium]|nr:prepilin-type N-terminal cleavage/methylation domain-containing protein [Deltaproteobacteria bacterium]
MLAMHEARDGRSSAGFTIIEVMISMLLLSIMMVGMAAMQVTVLRTSASSRQTTMATQIAQSRLEEFRIRPVTLLIPVALASDGCLSYDGFLLPTCPPATTYFTRELGIFSSGGSICGQPVSGAGLGVQVNVRWTDTNGPQIISLCLERTP